MPEAPELPAAGMIVVEAPTAEEALAEVSRRLGPGAEILEAGKVHRGGIGGFFARELVQLRARRPGAAPGATAAPAPAGPRLETSSPVAAQGRSQDSTALDHLLAELAGATDQEERTFAEVLRQRIPELSAEAGAPTSTAAPGRAPASPSAPSDPQPAVPAVPAVVVSPADVAVAATPERPGSAGLGTSDGRHGPDWSPRNLQKLGLPQLVVDAVRACDPADDAGCLAAVSRALDGLCRPLPAGVCAYVGPRAPRIAEATGAAVVALGEAPPEAGSFAVAGGAAGEVGRWLGWTRDRRWLHLVVGGDGWRELLFDEPLAVSWTAAGDLCEAVRVCAELGMVLGSGPMAAGRPGVTRANPVDLAYSIRDLLPAR